MARLEGVLVRSTGLLSSAIVNARSPLLRVCVRLPLLRVDTLVERSSLRVVCGWHVRPLCLSLREIACVRVPMVLIGELGMRGADTSMVSVAPAHRASLHGLGSHR